MLHLVSAAIQSSMTLLSLCSSREKAMGRRLRVKGCLFIKGCTCSVFCVMFLLRVQSVSYVLVVLVVVGAWAVVVFYVVDTPCCVGVLLCRLGSRGLRSL